MLKNLITDPNAPVTVAFAKLVEAEKLRLRRAARADAAVESAAPVVVKQVKRQKATGAGDQFKVLFDQLYGKVTRAELIARAIEAGIGKNTAATYYYNFSKAAKGK